MSSWGPVAQPLRPSDDFNWVLLIELIVCGILALFFLFYFNRLFATLVSYGIRAYTWHRFRAYIHIEALEISLLGGRVIFKGIRYHGHNETILVHGGYVTWRYWFLKVKTASAFLEKEEVKKHRSTAETGSSSSSRSRSISREERGSNDTPNDHPCRISAKLSGLEAFLYNRTPAYDSIVANMTRETTANGGPKESRYKWSSAEIVEGTDMHDIDQSRSSMSEKHMPPVQRRRTIASLETTQTSQAAPSYADDGGNLRPDPSCTLPDFLRVFPIYVECNKGAVVVGNENTKTVVTAKFDRATGEIDASRAGPFDLYKQVININVVHPVVRMSPNLDYKRSQMAAAARAKHLVENHRETGDIQLSGWRRLQPHWKIWRNLRRHRLMKSGKSAGSFTPSTGDSEEKKDAQQEHARIPGQTQWLGLTRYLESDHDYHDGWDDVEYAAVSTIADLESVAINYHWDIPGTVQAGSSLSDKVAGESRKDINGCVAPDYGLDMTIRGGVVNYGPWADRHRVVLQSVFFPATYRDTEAASALRPGDIRVATTFKLFMHIEEEVVVRIPFRESSKDWKWKGRSHSQRHKGREKSRKNPLNLLRRKQDLDDEDVRPFAWLDVKVESDSTINYAMDMVADTDGYSNKLQVDISGIEICSSINHSMFWRSGRATVGADLPFPLKWNTLRTWKFDVAPSDVNLFLLRDHAFLINDLITDWSSGPPPDYFTFTPFRYLLNLDFNNFSLFLNTNDFNIIDHPSEIEPNSHLVLRVKRLMGDVTIPLDQYQPVLKDISFNGKGNNLDMELRVPTQNTVSTFLQEKNVAHLEELTLTGNYNLFTEVAAGNTDILNLDIFGSKLTLQAYGFLIRHFAKFKENYFGEDMHFKTSQEFELLGRQALEDDRETNPGQPDKKTNDLDTILTFGADEITIVLPCYLYAAKDNIRVNVTSFRADLRITNYYFDMMIDSSPISIGGGGPDKESSIQIFIDDLSVFGHKLFGLPPTEPTYVSIWEIDVGNITGECSTIFVADLIAAIRSLVFTIDDVENAVPIESAVVVPDITFVRLNTRAVRLWFRVDQEAFLLSTTSASVESNNWASKDFSQRLNVHVPDLTVACVAAEATSRHISRNHCLVDTHAYLQTTLNLIMLQRKAHFTKEQEKQQDYIEDQDRRTRRANFCLIPKGRDLPVFGTGRCPVEPAAMIYPLLPHPIPTARQAAETMMSTTYQRNLLTTLNNISLREEGSHFSFSSRGRREDLKSTHKGTRAASSPSISESLRQPRVSGMPCQPSFSSSQSPSPIRPDDVFGEHQEFHSFSRQRPKVASSTPFSKPHFSLDMAEPDLSEVPEIPGLGDCQTDIAYDPVGFHDVLQRDFDDESEHISFMISAEPGLLAYCKPRAILAAADLVDAIQPRDPDQILDDFQMTVISESLALNRRIPNPPKIFDMSFCIPCTRLRVINRYNTTSDPERLNEQDQYELALDQSRLFARFSTRLKEAEDRNKASLYITVGTMRVSVKEKHIDFANEDAAIQASMDNILLWLVSGGKASINLSFKQLLAATAGKNVEYLAASVHRTTLLIDKFIVKFTTLPAEQKLRLRYLAYQLTMYGGNVVELPFLHKPLYVVRANLDHLRDHVSWQIVSHLRYNYHTLPEEMRGRIRQQLKEGIPMCPDNTNELVVSVFEKWRKRGLKNGKDSIATRALYGLFADMEQLDARQTVPVSLAIKAACVEILVDPGPTQTEVKLDALAILLALSPPSAPSGLKLLEAEHHSKEVIVHVSLMRSTLRLNWELCELVEASLRLFEETAPSGPQNSLFLQPSKSLPEHSTSMQTIQVVFTTDYGSISLEGINVTHISATEGMKVSIMGNAMSIEPKLSISVMIHLDAATTELSNRSRILYSTKLTKPSLYVSHDSKVSHRNLPDTWRVASASNALHMEIKAEIPELLDVLNMVLTDEVTFIKRMINARIKRGGSQKLVSDPKQRARIPYVQMAMFLGSYRVDIALLSSLTHSVRGTGVRVTATPDDTKESAFDFDYDVRQQSHHLQRQTASKSGSISTFKVPSINGRVQVVIADTETVISVLTAMEKVSFEAAELHGLFVTVTSSDVMDELKAIADDYAVVKRCINEVFPPKPGSPSDSSNNPLAYDVHAALAGLTIVAHTPGKLQNSGSADLVFELSTFQVIAANKAIEDGQILAFPNIYAELQQIRLDMRRSLRGKFEPCGSLDFAIRLNAGSKRKRSGIDVPHYEVRSGRIEINIFAETASTVVDVINHLQDRIKVIDVPKEIKHFRSLRQSIPQIAIQDAEGSPESPRPDAFDRWSSNLFSTSYSLELVNIQMGWIVGNTGTAAPKHETEDLILSLKRIELSTPREHGAQLMIQDLQLQMVPQIQDKRKRSPNSALLPEVVFNVAYESTTADRKLGFHAAGKSLDLVLTSSFLIPANSLERSISTARKMFCASSADWKTVPSPSGAPRKSLLGNKRFSSIVVDADFAGAVVYLEGKKRSSHRNSVIDPFSGNQVPQHGRYGQFAEGEAPSNVTLRAPGLALKVDFKDSGSDDPSLTVELKISASSNTIHPTVVPIVMEISQSVKEVVRDPDETEAAPGSRPAQKYIDEQSFITADPNSILGKKKLHVGLRICKQEFSLSCQPIARVAATARLDDIYITVDTVRGPDYANFFALSAAFTKLQTSIQHVYSRESTFSFDVDSIFLSLMNSKHFSGTSGINAIIKVNPTKTQINARQLQDFLLFREIWIPPEIRQPARTAAYSPNSESQDYFVQRYKQVASAAAFPWNATLAIVKLSVDVDLGQAIGRSAFVISDVWASSKKSSSSEQNLCIGIQKVSVNSTGRMSGFVEISDLNIRTSISWPQQEQSARQTPLIQASAGFNNLRVKAAFDYQAFAIADITSSGFLMYNVRDSSTSADRLVAILDGGKIQVFCTAVSAAQALALYQAFDRLVQEKQAAYIQSLKEIEGFLRRQSTTVPTRFGPKVESARKQEDDVHVRMPFKLHTDVVVTLQSVNVGAYPGTFFDHHIFKIEMSDVQARFAVIVEDKVIHSGLGMTLGQLRVSLASVATSGVPKTLGEVSVEEVVNSATNAKGGIILRVPKAVASMQTWQSPDSNHIDYIFKSAFEGKVDVGWNYSRIDTIRNMFNIHSRALATRLGKPLPESAVQIKRSPQRNKPKSEGEDVHGSEDKMERTQSAQEKITAVVNVPQSKYEYTALEPPIIETPQLRDMGEATPPLEWIGLHRDRLPNVTHQIVIVTLLEVAKEVEDAYSRILGSS